MNVCEAILARKEDLTKLRGELERILSESAPLIIAEGMSEVNIGMLRVSIEGSSPPTIARAKDLSSVNIVEAEIDSRRVWESRQKIAEELRSLADLLLRLVAMCEEGKQDEAESFLRRIGRYLQGVEGVLRLAVLILEFLLKTTTA